MTISDAETPVQGEPKQFKLWITDQAYILVNETGRCVSYCAEGALGFIVQLTSRAGGRGWALKMPRLMGETHRENAYISDLMDKELKAVFMVQGDGVLRAENWGIGGPMRGQVNLRQAPEEAREWDGAIILICFERGENPRFCLIKEDANGGIKHFPPGNVDCPIKTAELLKRVTERAAAGSENWSRTVFIELGGESNAAEPDGGEKGGGEKDGDPRGTPARPAAQTAINIFDKDQALQLSPIGKTWYTCIPSVAYTWAPGTLQEAISLGRRGAWDIDKHLSLMSRLCQGLSKLHSGNMLHADLRPANITYEGDPQDPKNYVLSDYGSFAETGAREPDGRPTGGTVLGPVVGTERVSPFYAPERRAGREREAADVAVILDSGGGENIDIMLGWRSKLLDPETSTVPIDLTADLEKFDDTAPESSADRAQGARRAQVQKEAERVHSTANLLKEGDRIQIRDYIFDVVKSTDIDDKQILECKRRCWKIYHGRIVVSHDETFPLPTYFPITRTVELLQWSAATDLYSLGALSLYSVYRDDKVSRDENHQLKESSLLIEESFREMLRYLENEEYFNSIWPELEWFRRQLEEKLAEYDGKSRADFSNAQFERQDSTKPADDRQTLKGEAVALVRRLTQTVPGTRRLVEAFEFKLGPFIFFIHFVLCCLHRRSELHEPEKWEEKPFCASRAEKPSADGGASLAWKRLGRIRDLIVRYGSNLAELDTDGNDIPPFEPRPEPTLRVAIYNLTQRYDQTVNQLDEKIASLRGGLDSVKRAQTEVATLLRGGLDEAKSTHQDSVSSLGSWVGSVTVAHAESTTSLRDRLNTMKKAKVLKPKQDIESMGTLLDKNDEAVRNAIMSVNQLLAQDEHVVRKGVESVGALLGSNEEAVQTTAWQMDKLLGEAKVIVNEAGEYIDQLLNRPKKGAGAANVGQDEPERSSA